MNPNATLPPGQAVAHAIERARLVALRAAIADRIARDRIILDAADRSLVAAPYTSRAATTSRLFHGGLPA